MFGLDSPQNKGDVQEKEVKKFDGTGYDKDLVEALERDIISQNPNVKWLVGRTSDWFSCRWSSQERLDGREALCVSSGTTSPTWRKPRSS